MILPISGGVRSPEPCEECSFYNDRAGCEVRPENCWVSKWVFAPSHEKKKEVVSEWQTDTWKCECGKHGITYGHIERIDGQIVRHNMYGEYPQSCWDNKHALSSGIGFLKEGVLAVWYEKRKTVL